MKTKTLLCIKEGNGYTAGYPDPKVGTIYQEATEVYGELCNVQESSRFWYIIPALGGDKLKFNACLFVELPDDFLEIINKQRTTTSKI